MRYEIQYNKYLNKYYVKDNESSIRFKGDNQAIFWSNDKGICEEHIQELKQKYKQLSLF